MDKYEIVRLVNDHLTYKPGWTVEAYAPDHVVWTGSVEVYCEFVADNSTPRDVDARPQVIASGTFTVRPGSYDDVIRQLLDGLIFIETHEAREFMRIDGEAPFHPHRADGDERWAREPRYLIEAVA